MLPFIALAAATAAGRFRGRDDKQQLRIAYLFLSSENRINDSDFALFEEMGKSIKGFQEMKGEIIGECEKILAPQDGGKSRFEIVSEFFSTYKTSGGSDVNRNCDILWALLFLQYRKQKTSEKQQNLIDLWVEANRIDKAIALEMRDTLETQNAIVEYQRWLETTKTLSYQEINPFMQEVDKSLKSIQRSVSELIALG